MDPTEELILRVRASRNLYDHAMPNYYDLEKARRTWKSIGVPLGMDGKLCLYNCPLYFVVDPLHFPHGQELLLAGPKTQMKWRNIRTAYVRTSQRVRAGHVPQRPWKYAEFMSFLDPYITWGPP